LLIADYSLGDALLTVLEIFFLVVFFWILITIIGDLFRDHEMSGWGKAVWVLVLVILPFLGALIYLIARGEGMRERAAKEQAEVRRHMDAYVRETAGSSPADELHKLNELKEKGVLSDAEFERAKATVLNPSPPPTAS
jgi:ABC-type transport system involved in cytochrome bd biosynthesis fused ATPase/permease subunit